MFTLTIQLQRSDSNAKRNLFLLFQLFLCLGHLSAGVLNICHLEKKKKIVLRGFNEFYEITTSVYFIVQN